MRLMTSEKGEETPMEKYIRYKEDISLWYQEMEREQLTTEEMKTLEPYFLSSYGVPPSQEQLMRMLMDEKICNFGLAEANDARKIVGKKQMSRIPELRDKVITRAANGALGRYVWKYGIGPQMGYSFSVIHALAYSFIGFQTAYIATKWNPIYWDCACLIVNSGSLEDNSTEEIVDIYEPEHQEMLEGTTYEDLPDRSGKIKRTAATDYAKVAKAIGDITSRGIKVSLVDINKSDYGFKPDVENNQILYGLKALSNVGEPVIEAIKCGRPYKSIVDFMNRCPLSKTAMISLIKSGAFDNVDKSWANNLPYDIRLASMSYYISKACEPKKKLTMQNFGGLLRADLIPDELIFEAQTFNFNDYLKKNQKYKTWYVFNDICYSFFKKHEDVFDEEKLEVIQNYICIDQKEWKKMYDKVMANAKAWLINNQEEALKLFNEKLFNDMWNKYAAGSISAWEMEAVCFYYHEHELAHIDKDKYGIENFFTLESEEVDYFFKRNDRQIPIYKTHRIAGTVLSKNDNRSSFALLTTEGVVNVKLTREYYARIAKQISEKQADGTKKVVEKGWLKRGSKLMVTGFKRDDMFVGKTYKNTVGHQIYLIKEVNEDGTLELTHNRYGESED